jgi:hypothetical protein
MTAQFPIWMHRRGFSGAVRGNLDVYLVLLSKQAW